jgi:hypothetical protein
MLGLPKLDPAVVQRRAIAVGATLGLALASSWVHEATAQIAAPPSTRPPAVQPPPVVTGTSATPETPAAAPSPLIGQAAPPGPLIAPSIIGPPSIPLPPPKFDVPLLGSVYVDGAVSGLGQWQNNPFPGNHAREPDLSNGQLFVQKTDGVFQFYTQFGAYSIAALGTPYIPASTATFGESRPGLLSGNLWGWFPQGFAKIQPTDNFSVEGGKLSTLLGAEYTFSVQNINIERGLLWNQEPAVTKGALVNYTIDPVLLQLSLTDGFDSGVYNWVTGASTWTISSTNTLAFVAGGNVGRTDIATLRTPLPQNNSQIYNLIYTYIADPWIIQPYVQVTHVPAQPSLGWTTAASTFGVAVLGNYDLGDGFNLGGRLEYINSTGNVATAPNLLYGPGSGAFSFTLTPCFQWSYYFARAEFSWVKANNVVTGFGLGPNADGSSQTRVMLETGIMF